jgi:hypothetical protein
MQQKYGHHVLGYKVQQRKLKLSHITTNSKNVTIDSLQLAEAPIGHVDGHVLQVHALTIFLYTHSYVNFIINFIIINYTNHKK